MTADASRLSSPHCCICTAVCGHIGGPFYCARHDPRAHVVPERHYPPLPTIPIPGVPANPEIERARQNEEFVQRLRERMEADKNLLRRIEEGPVDWRSAWSAEAAKFQAETITTSFLATRLRDGGNLCDRCRERDGSTIVVGVGLDRGWVCGECARGSSSQGGAA